MVRRLHRRLIWLAAFAWTSAAVGDLSVDGPAQASPAESRPAVQSAWTQPACTPNLLRGCPRYDDSVPR
jgi:hypothetical protein